MTGSGTLVLWDEALLAYDLGDHPLDPVRVELTIALARELGIFERAGVTVAKPVPADDARLGTVHTPEYLDIVKAASVDQRVRSHGLGTPDNPTFTGMHDASALVAGASVAAAEAVWTGRARHAVNIAGGLHHAMPSMASGFCVYNDPAIAIKRLLELGAERVAYVDVDVHHGDGVQAVFYDDPRVLTVSLHESPLTLFPGTGFAAETGGDGAEGSAVNVALAPGVGDDGWLRAFHAIVPSVLRAFRPQILVSQCGADAHGLDPLADLQLTVDGQRASYLAMKALADELCDGRWVATGGGGYALVEVVPRAWTHLLGIATGEPIEPATATPAAWRELAADRRPGRLVPASMTDGATATFQQWAPGTTPDSVDRSIVATRNAVFPLHGLDPMDARD
ncbi:MAG TPA: acetoin utilization protein AcuC [Micromonosporaceae bacterium]|nr:acetoin utilization protein AcuC [Micromonosporaceae bacterium]